MWAQQLAQSNVNAALYVQQHYQPTVNPEIETQKAKLAALLQKRNTPDASASERIAELESKQKEAEADMTNAQAKLNDIEQNRKHQARILELQEKEKEMLYAPTQEVIFELFPIRSKVISEKKLVGQLKEINIHDGILEMIEENDADVLSLDAITVFSDVEIRTREEMVTPKVAGVYAKITKIEGKSLQLRFTHSNKDFKQFVETIIKG